ncbi:AbrB/MazE/SpoVT family DNA-binding domain-containing protein [Methanobrevibacter filiformis]|uniref:SpoVT / AbrB like domain protein n=1 Tax=Methanobrevibacter filiformis TaxID=55758 RepID=A0A166EV94_9EURY|nr:AbrB/MazE/SpoVT family DNA-binding domain-containing protein [Methanobrevibacter filiformis]KZX17052.1 SpoVT / AbrB like domain protein [Methanobrevibacter filiformis]
MVLTTKIYNKFQTVIPKEIREKLHITEDYLVEWYLDEKGEVKLKFVEDLSFENMAGIFSSPKPTDAVKLKKQVQRGKK